MMTAVRYDTLSPLETAVLSHLLDRRRTMSELEARYKRGQNVRRMCGGGTITSAGMVVVLALIATLVRAADLPTDAVLRFSDMPSQSWLQASSHPVAPEAMAPVAP